jgi:hypothetical protein
MPLIKAEESMVSEKIADKEGQGQGPRYPRRHKATKPQPPEEGEETQAEKRVIDIVV